MQVIPTGIGDVNMDALDSGFGLLPVVGELLLPAHGLLRFAQVGSIPLEDVERRNDRSVRERCKTDHAHIDAYGITLGNRLLDLAFSLDRNEPFAVAVADGDVLHRTKNLSAVAVAQPAKFWQEYPAISLIQFETLRETEAVAVATLLEARILSPLLEEVGEGAIQILERML